MSSPTGAIRKRNTKDKQRPTTPNPEALSEQLSEKAATIIERVKPSKSLQHGSEWDYKLAISIITVLAFITRFWGIRHPDQVVFDEVHFGKVRSSQCSQPFEHPLACFQPNKHCSSLPTTCNEPTSSMSTLLSESSSSLSPVGSSDTRATSCLRTLATRTSPTRSHMSHTAQCPPPLAPSRSQLSS
jgi:hypothetical protein